MPTLNPSIRGMNAENDLRMSLPKFARGHGGNDYNGSEEISYAAVGSFSTADFQQRFLGRFSWNVACDDRYGSLQIAA